MSTENEFQVGDTVRVLPTEADPKSGLHPNEHRKVEHADATHVRVEGSPYEWFARRFALVERAATPAPLDPKAVKAGDTVTVTIAEYGDTPEFQITGPVYCAGHGLGDLVVGDYMLMHKRVTLTAHTPAPEPEPEWKPGTVAAVTYAGFGWVDEPASFDGAHWRPLSSPTEKGVFKDNIESPEDVRPLVVIDPATVDVDHLVDVGSETDDPRTNTIAILTALGLGGAR